jgi:hypothetical protein
MEGGRWGSNLAESMHTTPRPRVSTPDRRQPGSRTFNGAALLRSNTRCARSVWGILSKQSLERLAELTKTHRLSVNAGHLQFLDGGWYITHSGLLSVAQRNRCAGIRTVIEKQLCDPGTKRWVFKATVYGSRRKSAFVGYGDADPSNTSPLVRGAEMRVAETRAVNRALRKAYGIGLCSVEELGSFSAPQMPLAAGPHSNGHAGANGSSNGQPRLRDQLCLLIRQHGLDPTLVKAYAADFCGTATLKEASRDLVESFITQLAAAAKKDRDGLLCKLNSYAQPVEANP